MKKLNKIILGTVGGLTLISANSTKGYGTVSQVRTVNYQDPNIYTAQTVVQTNAKPTTTPTGKPTSKPTATLAPKPTYIYTSKPTATPTGKPTAKATATPNPKPGSKVTPTPEAKPTAKVSANSNFTPQTIVTGFFSQIGRLFGGWFK